MEEPEHLERYAPHADRPRSPRLKARKRRKLNEAQDLTGATKPQSGKTGDPMQRRISEGLRVTKPRHSSYTASKKAAAVASTLDTYQETSTRHGHNLSAQRWPNVSHSAGHNTYVERSTTAEAEDSERYKSPASPGEQFAEGPIFDFKTNDCDTNDYERYDVTQVPGSDTVYEEEDFDDDLNDEEFLKLTSDIIDTGGASENVLSPPFKADVMHTVTSTSQCPDTSAPTSVAGQKEENKADSKSNKFVSPITLTTRLLAATGDIDSAAARKPIVRHAYPDAVRDRSPIIGLSSNIVLRTCFRIGEAINQAHQSSKSGKHVVFELYARILESERDDTTQYFTFCDLFHGKPPYIKATYSAALWKPVQLFNYDCTRLQQQGRICRCMGTLKRDGKEWVMSVLNIWEATWDDIKWVEGIVNS
jgi:hypothetical protein